MICFIISQLQQFRQKKDGKGNSSKPSSKGVKSGRDTTASTVAEAAVTQQNVLDGEISKHDTNEHDATMGTSTDEAVAQQHDADGDRFKHDAEDTTALPESDSRVDTMASDTASSKSGHVTTAVGTGEAALMQGGEKYADDTIALSESASRVDSGARDSAAANVEPSAKADVGITYISEATEYPSEGSGVDYSKLNQSSVTGHDVGSSVDQKDGPSSLLLEDTTNNPEIVLEGRSGDSSLPLPTDFSSGLEREHGEEQVTDVGLCLHS